MKGFFFCKKTCSSALNRCITLIAAFLLTSELIAQPVSDIHPFLPYLDGKAPQIVKYMGEESNDSVKVNKFLFLSRKVARGTDSIASHIFAAIARPTKPGRYPGLLVLHGGGGHAEVDKAMEWAAKGYVAMVLDEPGIADPAKITFSTGHWMSYEHGKQRFTANPDVRASVIFDGVVATLQALYLLRSQPDVMTDQVGVVGISLGGYLTTMVTALAGKYIRASFSIFGSGYYDLGSWFEKELNQMPPAERELWLRHLDAGRWAAKIKTPFFVAAAANDRFFYPPAVQATLHEMKGKTNQLFAPNANHQIPVAGGMGKKGSHTGWLQMEQTYFDYYLKGKGDRLPIITQIRKPLKTTNENTIPVTFVAKGEIPIATAQLFYSKADTTWPDRKWEMITAKPVGKNKFEAVLPKAVWEAGIDWFVSVSDQRPVTVSSYIYHSR
jgi:cephalosporin-C deacetylase-like acetyl esterase